MTNIVRAIFPEAGEVSLLFVPAWVRNPTALPRRDGKHAISIKVTRRYRREQWLIIGGSGPSEAVAFCLLGRGTKVVDEADVLMTVYVPPLIYTNFRVRRAQPRS